jgi:ribose transport system permease protein
VAIALILLVALAVGLINSGLTILLSVDPFIATMGTGFIMTGLSQLIAKGTTITLYIPAGFTDFGRTSIHGIPIDVFVFIGLAAVVWYLFTLTPLGPTLYATGAAREASRLAGIRTNRVIVLGFCSSAIGATIAGVLFAAQTGSGPPSIGDGYLLGAYATAFLGSTMIRPGRFNVEGLIVATLIIAFSVNGLELRGTQFWVTGIFQGFALLFAVALAKVGKRRTLV